MSSGKFFRFLLANNMEIHARTKGQVKQVARLVDVVIPKIEIVKPFRILETEDKKK